MPASNRDHLTNHLRLVPAHRAIVRALEAKIYDGMIFAQPVLDLGCGDGYFAQAALPVPLDAGIDPSPAALAECARLGIYRELKQASGAEIPFPDSSFATVVSNCVLEHIPEIDKTLGEINRVLKPVGTFVGTMVTDQLSPMLGIPRYLRSLGMDSAALAYTTWFNRKAVHYNMLSLADWTTKLDNAGLRVTRSQFYMGPAATRVFDFLHYFALPSLFVHTIFRRWLLWQDARNVAFTAAMLRGVYNEPTPTNGACVFVIAVKK
jgi:ubiquinone/menaquinone biosynthesis C-methylase UbiE